MMEKILLLGFFAFSLQASIVAVIDSGTDIQHEALSDQLWKNPLETLNEQDDDGNGYIDDIYGWNFVKKSSSLMDRSQIGTFSDTPYKFFELQSKSLLGGTLLEEEKQWLADVRKNPTAMKEIQAFGGFVHGTHVSGITAISPFNEILSVKLIPTQVKFFTPEGHDREGLRVMLVKKILSYFAKKQMTTLQEISRYLAGHQTRVANGSFGISTPTVEKMVASFYNVISFLGKPSPEELEEVTAYFFSVLSEGGKEMVDLAPETLFVFAAGNDSLNNDVKPCIPANIKESNTITVAATQGRYQLASFSNYGKSKVEIAAPGVAIKSSIPGDEYMRMSGTSQAAPYVSSVAGLIFSINPKLSPAEVKYILMKTVDYKAFLRNEVSSGGIVNDIRAKEAAHFSLSMLVSEATQMARQTIKDNESDIPFRQGISSVPVDILPLPSLFTYEH